MDQPIIGWRGSVEAPNIPRVLQPMIGTLNTTTAFEFDDSIPLIMHPKKMPLVKKVLGKKILTLWEDYGSSKPWLPW